MTESEQNSCTHPHRIYDNGFLVCTSCGRCLDVHYVNDPPRLKDDTVIAHFSPLPVVHGYYSRTVFNPKKSANPKLYYRLRRHNDARTTTTQNALLETSVALRRFASILKLPREHAIFNQTMKLLKTIYTNKIMRFHNRECVAAASLYVVLRTEFSIFPSITGMSKKLRINAGRLKSDIEAITCRMKVTLRPPTLVEYASRRVPSLKLRPETEQKIYDALQRIEQEKNSSEGVVVRERLPLSGKSAKGIVAGVVYVIAARCNENRTQNELALVFDVSEVTIRNRAKTAKKLGVV